jgi:predicted alpha/beta superfamily hydrolase
MKIGSVLMMIAALTACAPVEKSAVKQAAPFAAIEQVKVKSPPAPAPSTMPANPPSASTPTASTAQPNVHVLAPLAMPALDRTRTIRLYLPPGYETSKRHYPVLYMHDGQNLFDAATAYAGEWGVDETLNDLARTKGLELIVVGIDNGGTLRIHELNAWDNEKFGKGEGREYMRFVVEVVKPYIDAHYRTKSGRADTAIMGSSMGGLISHYAIAAYPEVFSKAGIFSPAYWLAPPIFDDPAESRLARDAKLYFYAGGKEGEKTMPGMSGMQNDMNRMVDAVRKAGHPPRNLFVHVNPEAQHNEAAWRAEFPKAVEWLFLQK